MNTKIGMLAMSLISGGILFLGIKHAPDIAKQFGRPEDMRECRAYVDTDLLPKRCSRFVVMHGWRVEERYQAAYAVADAYAEEHPGDRWSIALNFYKSEINRLNKVNENAEKIAENYEKGSYVLTQMTERDTRNALDSLRKLYDSFISVRRFEENY